jgi:hypothetical protein
MAATLGGAIATVLLAAYGVATFVVKTEYHDWGRRLAHQLVRFASSGLRSPERELRLEEWRAELDAVWVEYDKTCTGLVFAVLLAGRYGVMHRMGRATVTIDSVCMAYVGMNFLARPVVGAYSWIPALALAGWNFVAQMLIDADATVARGCELEKARGPYYWAVKTAGTIIYLIAVPAIALGVWQAMGRHDWVVLGVFLTPFALGFPGKRAMKAARARAENEAVLAEDVAA